MKLYHGFVLLALVAAFIFCPAQQVRAQDTLVVQWENPDHTVKINALRTAFVSDTIARPAGRVYKLLRGGYYWQEDRIENAGRPLRIVGEAAGTTPTTGMPVLQMVRRTDGTVDQRMITGQDNVTIKNVFILGSDDLGTQTAYQQMQVDASGKTFVYDNCVFERANFAIVAFQGSGNKITFVNCKFRNLIGRPSTQQWEGRGISVWAAQDSVIVENNTFFNVGFTPFQMESGAIKYLRFNHNTLVNIGRGFTGAWWREAYFTNNLFINPFWHGEGVADYTASGRDPRSWQSGIWNIGPLPSIYGPEDGRRLLFGFNAAWRDAAFSRTGLYGDTIRPQSWIGDVTRLDFLTGTPKPYENMVVRDTTWLGTRPNIGTFGSPDTLLPKMWANITNLRRAITPATPWFYNVDTGCGTCVEWPLTENFAYTTPANLLTAGSDHLPLGDLNWFPTQKAQFLANQAKYLDTLHTYAGPITIYNVKGTKEAEVGTLASGAAVSTFAGFSYFQMDGGGSIDWSFNVTSSGQYDMDVLTNMRGNDTRGQHTRINGVAVHDSAFGYGELIYSNGAGPSTTFPNPHQGMPLNEWTWVHWTAAMLKMADRPALTLAAGANTLQIASSWGYQNFSQINFVKGTDTIKLKAPDAVNYVIVTPRGEGAPWVPSKFKSVIMGTNGSVTWDGIILAAQDAGSYAVQLFFQNYKAATTAQIKVDGVIVVPSVAIASRPDSTGGNILTRTRFPVTAGTHSLAVTGSGFTLDFVQLIQVITDVYEENGLPESYTLYQNYPNPFNPSTTINFALAKASNVTLTVYNILGQRVVTLVNGHMDAGTHSVMFNAVNLATGVYFYRLEAGGFVAQKKLMLLK